MYTSIADYLMVAKQKHDVISARQALKRFSEDMIILIETIKTPNRLQEFSLFDKRYIFPSSHSDKIEEVDVTITSDGLISQLLVIAGVTQHQDLAIALDQSISNFYASLDLHSLDMEDNRKTVLDILDTILLSVE